MQNLLPPLKKLSAEHSSPLSDALLFIIIISMFAFCLSTQAQFEIEEEEFNIEADSYELDQSGNWAHASGEVVIEYGKFRLEADKVSYNTETGQVKAEGEICLSSRNKEGEEDLFTWKTEKLSGNFESGQFTSSEYHLRHGETFIQGPKAERDENGNFRLPSARISTCDHLADEDPHPHYEMHAREILYSTEKEQFQMNHALLKIGPVPVFYLPVFYWNRNWSKNNLTIRVGHKSEWGSFAIIGRRFQLNDETTIKLGIEGRTKRGVALSAGLRHKTDNSNTELSLYGMRDAEPPETDEGFNRRFKSEEDRYRIQLYHHHKLTDRLDLRLNLDKLSDIDMLEEWFIDEYRRSPQPRSYIDLRYHEDWFNLSLAARPQINDFYTVVERMPELRFEVPRQPVSDSGFYYQTDTSLARLHTKWRDFDRPLVSGMNIEAEDYSAWRFDTLHMLYRPFDLGQSTQFTPRAGLRVTHYSDSSGAGINTGDLVDLYRVDDPYLDQFEDVDELDFDTTLANYDDQGGAITRWTGELGFELSRKFTAVWPDSSIPLLRDSTDGTRLITRPYANYTYIPEPSEDRDHIYHFDRVDRIMKQNFIRLGTEQRLQTRNPEKNGIYTVARMNTYADFHFETPPERGNLGNLASKIEITPPNNLSFNTLLIFDMDQANLNYMRNRLTIREIFDTPADFSLEYSFSDSYRSTELNTMGSTLVDYRGESLTALEFSPTNEIFTRLDFPIGDKTEAALGFGFDFDQTAPSRQMIEIRRQLHCWNGVLRYERYGNGSGAGTEISFMLYLNAFPGVGIGYGI